MKQNILFDLDDTLIYCNKYFHEVLKQFADAMLEWFSPFGATRESIVEKHTEIDIAGVKVLGFQSEHFPQSFVDTYRFYAGRHGVDVDAKREQWLWQLGISVYDHEVEPYPHMEETLETLIAEGHRLHLYTGGEPAIQRRKIERMRLERFFQDRIYVRQHKNTTALRAILKSGRFDLDRTWMIGNSLRTDVMPALECGIHSIYLKREEEWAYNVIPIEASPQGAFITLSSLNEVPPAIGNYLVKMKEPG
ncbi:MULTISPECIES: HAD family hydrolase [Cohnella]|uniref:HAD family hydrolase n=1 Tax=Cohnella TaxID=329857 RepID=UPI0009B97B00|nr:MULTISPECIES: HAD hydrolase-like protein [Cohnella]MBN2983879.1 HAD hydrolase-like protein [Cohnella algarum]